MSKLNAIKGGRRLSMAMLTTGMIVVGASSMGATAIAEDNPPPDSSSVEDEILSDFWNPERMKSAELMDRAPEPAQDEDTIGKRGLIGALDRGDPLEITGEEGKLTRGNHTAHVGRLFFTKPGGGLGACTANVVGSANHSTLATAAHCLTPKNAGGKFFADLEFVPSYHDGEAPYGKWRVHTKDVPEVWKHEGSRIANLADIGFFTVGYQRVGSSWGRTSIAEALGASTIAFNSEEDQKISAYGYPASVNNGMTLASCTSGGQDAKQSFPSREWVADCQLSRRNEFPKGISGGPVMNPDIDGRQVGVVTQGSTNGSPELSLGRFWNVAEAIYKDQAYKDGELK